MVGGCDYWCHIYTNLSLTVSQNSEHHNLLSRHQLSLRSRSVSRSNANLDSVQPLINSCVNGTNSSGMTERTQSGQYIYGSDCTKFFISPIRNILFYLLTVLRTNNTMPTNAVIEGRNLRSLSRQSHAPHPNMRRGSSRSSGRTSQNQEPLSAGKPLSFELSI